MKNARRTISKKGLLLIFLLILQSCGGAAESPDAAVVGADSRIEDDLEQLKTSAEELEGMLDGLPQEQLEELHLTRIALEVLRGSYDALEADIATIRAGGEVEAEMYTKEGDKMFLIDQAALEAYEAVINASSLEGTAKNAGSFQKSLFGEGDGMAAALMVCNKTDEMMDVFGKADGILGSLCLGAVGNVALPGVDEAVACGALALNQEVSTAMTIFDLLCQFMPLYVDDVTDIRAIEYFQTIGVIHDEPCLRQISEKQPEPDKMDMEAKAWLVNRIDTEMLFEGLIERAIEKRFQNLESVSSELQSWLSDKAAKAVVELFHVAADALGLSFPTSVSPVAIERYLPDGYVAWSDDQHGITVDGNAMLSTTYRGLTTVRGHIVAEYTRRKEAIDIDAGDLLLSGLPEIVEDALERNITSNEGGYISVEDIDRDIYYVGFFEMDENGVTISSVTGGTNAGVIQHDDVITIHASIDRANLEQAGSDVIAFFARDKCRNYIYYKYQFEYEPYCTLEECLSPTFIIYFVEPLAGVDVDRSVVGDPDYRYDNEDWYIGQQNIIPAEKIVWLEPQK